MKMTKFCSAIAAAAVSVSSVAAMTLFNANAAVTTIAHTQSAEATNTENDGRSLRVNIYNIWGQKKNIEDIDPNTAVEDNITINFTIKGIGSNSHNTNENMEELDAYYAFVSGNIAGVDGWEVGTSGNDKVMITGDGSYTAVWNGVNSENISALALSTNINYFNYGQSIEESGITITIDSITTGKADDDTTEAPTNGDDTKKEDTTKADDNKTEDTTKADDTKKETTTTAADKKDDKSTTTTTASKKDSAEKSANTGVAGVGTAVAALAVAGTAAVITRKKD